MTPSAVGTCVAAGPQHNANGKKLERVHRDLAGCFRLEIYSCDVPDYIGEEITQSAEIGLPGLTALPSRDELTPTSS